MYMKVGQGIKVAEQTEHSTMKAITTTKTAYSKSIKLQNNVSDSTIQNSTSKSIILLNQTTRQTREGEDN